MARDWKTWDWKTWDWKTWMRRLAWLTLMCVVCCFVVWTHTYAGPRQIGLNDVFFQRLDGTPEPADFTKNKAVVLNFWAPWCPPCRAEMPWLQHLHQANPGILVLGVEDDPDEYANALDLAAHTGITYPLVRSSQTLHRRLGDIRILPTTLFISRSGRVVHAVRGALPEPLMQRFARDAQAAR